MKYGYFINLKSVLLIVLQSWSLATILVKLQENIV